VLNAAQEPSIVLEKVDAAAQRNFGYNAARRAYGDMMEMGVIDPAKVTRLALQNAGSIAALILTVDCLIADAPKKPERLPEGALPEGY
jgi:chaperonin GroEL